MREPLRRAPVEIDRTAFEQEFTGANALATQAVRNLVRLADVIVASVNSRLKVHDLHLAASQALAVLEGADHPLTPNEINEHLHLTSGSVTTLLDGLERKGLVRRGPHPEDRRKVLVSITDEGRRTVDRFLPESVAIHSALLEGLSDRELAELNRLVSKALTTSADVDPHRVAEQAPRRNR